MTKQRWLQKSFSIFTGLSLLLQSLLPGLSALTTTTAYAQEATPTPTTSDAPAPTVEPTVIVEPTIAPTEIPTPTDVVTPAPTTEVTSTPAVSPTDAPTPTDIPTATITPIPSEEPTLAPTAPVNDNSPPTDEKLLVIVLDNISATSIDLGAVTESGSATLTTDKADYAPTDTALISGTGYNAGQTYTLIITSSDVPAVNFSTAVTADSDGTIIYAYQLDGNYRPNYQVAIKDVSGTVLATTSFTDANVATDISQCQNGGIGDPLQPCNESTFPAASGYGYEGNANSNGSNSHWYEGDFVPIRIVATNYSAGAGNIQFSIDITKGGKHAYDYIGSFDATETTGASSSTHANHNNPVGDIISGADPTAPNSQGVIPVATLSSFPTACGSNTWTGGAQPSGQNIKAWGTSGPLTVTYVSENVGSSDCTTTIQVAWTATQASFGGTIVIAYAPHIARQADWGTGNSAINISGSPYHSSLVQYTTGGATKGIGQQDAKLAASAVIVPNTITIHKVTSPAGGTGFGFTTTGGLTPSTFSLNDSVTQTFSPAPGSYTISETSPLPAYALTNLACSASGTGTSGTPNIGTRTASITIGAGGGGNVDCTYTNTLQQAHLTLVKTITNNNGGTAAATAWTLSASGPTNISGVTGNAAVTNATVNSGTYTLSESGPTGYTGSTYSCINNGGVAVVSNSIALAAGDNATCTINNNDNAPHLIVIKHVINDNGGTKAAGDFTTTITGVTTAVPTAAGVESPGVDNVLTTVGSYSVDEGVHTGYTKTLSTGCSGTIALGETKTCTITNDDIAPTLKLVKVVTNNNGGNKNPVDWTLTATGTNGFSDLGNSTTFHAVNAGVGYVLSESTVPGYDAGSWSCDVGNLSGSTVTLSLTQNATCTITNDDQAAHIIIIKQVTNDNGGTKVAGDFSGTISGVTVSGGNAWTGTATPGVNKTLTTVGIYTVAENADSTYATTYSADCTGTIALGETKTCTVTNNDRAAHVVVIKHVINDNGGTKVTGDFMTTISGVTTAIPTASGVESPGVDNVLTTVGSYSVNEGAHVGYDKTLSADCTGTIALGQTKTCTITNDDIQPKLTLTKIVTNDDGGNAVVSDFPLFVNSTGVTSGVQNGFNVGSYAASETNLAGYTAGSWTGDCAANGTITLVAGDVKSCSINNNDQPANITLIKHVTNNNGGSAGVNDFGISINGLPVTSSTTYQVNSNTAQAINEAGLTGYGFVNITGDAKCPAILGGNVTLNEGESVTCTINNDDIAPKLHLRKIVTNNNGGTATVASFSLTADGSDTNDLTGTSPVDSGVTLQADTFALSETSVAGYAASSWVCTGGTQNGSSIAVGIGGEATCTITNDDIAPQLTVIKHVINDDGDIAAASDFTMNVTGTNVSNPSFPGSESGVTVTLNAGSYSANEALNNGYVKTLSADCTGTIAVGESKTCTITNNDIPHATRTLGFWQTHTAYTTTWFNSGLNPLTIGTRVINSTSKLFAGFYAGISKKSTGVKRTAIDQARMQLLQQWLASELNCKAFGCGSSTQTLLANAAAAWTSGPASLILSYASQLDAYNNSNDAIAISGQGKATPKTSQSQASSSLSYWDLLP